MKALRFLIPGTTADGSSMELELTRTGANLQITRTRQGEPAHTTVHCFVTAALATAFFKATAQEFESTGALKQSVQKTSGAEPTENTKTAGKLDHAAELAELCKAKWLLNPYQNKECIRQQRGNIASLKKSHGDAFLNHLYFFTDPFKKPVKRYLESALGIDPNKWNHSYISPLFGVYNAKRNELLTIGVSPKYNEAVVIAKCEALDSSDAQIEAFCEDDHLEFFGLVISCLDQYLSTDLFDEDNTAAINILRLLFPDWSPY